MPAKRSTPATQPPLQVTIKDQEGSSIPVNVQNWPGTDTGLPAVSLLPQNWEYQVIQITAEQQNSAAAMQRMIQGANLHMEFVAFYGLSMAVFKRPVPLTAAVSKPAKRK